MYQTKCKCPCIALYPNKYERRCNETTYLGAIFFFCPCNMFSLLTEVISSVSYYAICSLMASGPRLPEIPKILFLILCPKHFMEEKQMQNAVKDV